MPMMPVPDTHDALLQMGRRVDRDLNADLVHQAELVEDVVPNLVGLSLALVREGLTFTIAASQERVALLDAIQYAFGGPCVAAALEDVTVLSGDRAEGLSEEPRWAEFARACTGHGVLSTLSLPVHVGGQAIGGVNLYAATPDAFAGKEQQVADILGAWAPGAVHNADQSFSHQAAARRASSVIDDLALMDQATEVVVAEQGVDEVGARRIIADAAGRAGVDEVAVAREFLQPYMRDDETS